LDFVSDLSHVLASSSGGHDVRAGFGQRDRDGAPEPGGASDDNCDAAG
jgi:hypothetical protein